MPAHDAQVPTADLPLPELLAPAGSPEAAWAALQYGADAIYLGVSKFSARAEATNFSLADLDQALALAHSLTPRRRVFVALNTVILDPELPEVIDLLAALDDLHVDALIVQDLGVARLVRRWFPRLELHASTQMAVHNVEGARALKTLGFSRVTLARELTLEEIRGVCAGAGIETEVFIHGALCYSYSGLCLFSSHLFGRSGNRGRCAYPCRDVFRVCGAAPDETPALPAAGLPFSMKDLALPDALAALRAAGVACLKIEGRMKAPLYVATVTDFYRRSLDARLTDDERRQAREDMATVFSRSATELYLHDRRNRDVMDPLMVGHRGAPIGRVSDAVPRRPGSRVLRFQSSRELELHDGIQLDIPGENRPYGFAIAELEVAGRRQFTSPAGAEVAIALPADAPAIPAGVQVYCASSQSVKRRFPVEKPKAATHRQRRDIRVSVQLAAAGATFQAQTLERWPGDMPVTAQVALPGPLAAARDAPAGERTLRDAFARLGDSLFKLAGIEMRGEPVFIPVSALNQLRRELAQALEAECTRVVREAAARVKAAELPAPASAVAGKTLSWEIKIDDAAVVGAFQAEDWRNVAEVILDIGSLSMTALTEALARLQEAVGPARVRLALPMITRLWETAALREKLASLAGRGWSRWQGTGLAAFDFLGLQPGAGVNTRLDLTMDWPVPVFNRMAAAQLLELGIARFTLSPEDGFDNARRLLAEFAEQAVVVVYQDTPLFISESCPFASLAGRCLGPGQCPFSEKEFLSSRGQRIVVRQEHCRTVAFSARPYSLGGKLGELATAGVRRVRADFLVRRYTPDEAVAVWRRLRQGQTVPGTHPGNFERGLS